MNDIGNSLLPVTPIVATAPGSAENATRDGGKNFDSLLQQRTDGTPDATIPTQESGQMVPIEDSGKPAIVTDAAEAAAQTGIIAMFSPPPILPVPTSPPDEANASPVTGGAIREFATDSPEPKPCAFPRCADNNAPAPTPPTQRQAAPPTLQTADANTPATVPRIPRQPAPIAATAAVGETFGPLAPPASVAKLASSIAESPAQPIPEIVASTQDAEPRPPQEETPAHDVASVLGIMPPVQAAPFVGGESTLQKANMVSATPALPNVRTRDNIPAPVGSRVITIAPAIPFDGAQTFGNTAGNEPAIVAGSTSDVAPATLVVPIGEPVRQEAATSARTPQILSQPASAVVQESSRVISETIKSTGMMAAKPGRVMPAPTLQRVSQTAPATSAEPVSNGIMPDAFPIDGTQTLRAAPVLAAQNGREHSANDHAENSDRPPTVEFAPANFSAGVPAPFVASDAAAPIRAADVTQVVTHTLRATEQLRASGQERVELAVKLEGGHQLTIHLHMANGEVMPIIRTESEPLRAALELNWSQFAQRGGDSDLRITTPVFESSKTSSNMSDFHQQRDGRQRAFNEPAQEFFQSPALRRTTPPNTPHPVSPTPAQTSGVRLYA